jgi:phosphopantothenoylcysteine decarboxylase/phosphopantothenate--cysteine ligase
MLEKKHILVGVTGGIAAYKIPFLIRELKKNGADVRVVMTEAATEFVTPLTLSTLSGNEVVVGMFPNALPGGVRHGTWHIELSRWADLMIIAPATANVVARLAHGEAENAVSTLALAVSCPIIVSPAMDVDMWYHPVTQFNVQKLKEIGYVVLPPEEGELASGLKGTGRLPEVHTLLQAVIDVLRGARLDLRHKKILITAGPTFEPIDPVRFIGNRSSGKMGFALARAAVQRGADVTLITGSVSLPTPRHAKRIDVETSSDMHRAVMKSRNGKDAVIMAAAVADFTPVQTFDKKIKKRDNGQDNLTVELTRTKDILADLASRKGKTILVGFALETHNELQYARKKLQSKKLDLIVINNPLREGAGFGADTNVITLLPRRGKIEKFKRMTKFDAANIILDRVVKLL